MTHSPFIVEMVLDTPMILDPKSQLTLDALCAASIFRATQDVAQAHSKIPLRRTDTVWHGSSMFLVDSIPGLAPFTRDLNPIRGDLPEYLGLPKKKIIRNGGPFKPTIDSYPTYRPHVAVWFGNGDMEAVSALLNRLNGIGRKVNHGYGQIKSIHVRPMKVDRSYMLPDGTPARPMPVTLWRSLKGVEDGLMDLSPIEPPYWDSKGRAVPCHVPTQRSLSMAHLEHIEAGMAPALLPTKPVASDDFHPWMSGVAFFHRHVGARLRASVGIPGSQKGVDSSCDVCGATEELSKAGDSSYVTVCPVCAAFAGQYEKIRRPGRMGAGWMGIVSPESASFVTSVEYGSGEGPFADMDGVSIEYGKSARDGFLERMITNPPNPPFVAFIGSNSSVRAAQNLTVSWSHERMFICGDTLDLINGSVVAKAIETWRTCGFDHKTLQNACRTLSDSNSSFDPTVREKAAKSLEALDKKHPGLLAVCESLPAARTTEFSYLMMVVNKDPKKGDDDNATDSE